VCLFISGVEEKYLGRLITSRSRGGTGPRNKLSVNNPEFLEDLFEERDDAFGFAFV